MNDLLNGLFETFGAVFLSFNVVRLHRDKKVRGVHWVPTTFFAIWGLWNLIYYPSLGQWYSFSGSTMVVLVNFTWLGQMIYYLKKEK